MLRELKINFGLKKVGCIVPSFVVVFAAKPDGAKEKPEMGEVSKPWMGFGLRVECVTHQILCRC